MKLLAHQDKMKDGKYFVELADEIGPTGYMTLEDIAASNQLYDKTRDEVLIVTGINPLIAAAPNIYEALKLALDEIVAAKKALAKAEGKEE